MMKSSDVESGQAGFSAPDSQAPAASDPRSGRLLRKLAFMFVVLACVSIAMTAAATYYNTSQTFFSSQLETLEKVAGYAEFSILSSGSDEGASQDTLDFWLAHGVSLDETMDELWDQVEASYEEYTAAESDNLSGGQTSAEEVQSLEDAYEVMYQTYLYRNILDMPDRLMGKFNLALFNMYIPNDDGETVEVVMISNKERDHKNDQIVLGDTLDRPSSDYATLWQAWDSKEPSAELAESPDGSLYLAYVPVQVSDGSYWLIEIGIDSTRFKASLTHYVMRSVLMVALVLLVCLAALLLLLRKSLVKPLVALTGYLQRFSESKSSDVGKSIRGRDWPDDECGILADGTSNMVSEICEYVEDIATLSAERERVRSELAVAHSIQDSALPVVEGPFVGREEFALAASMNPAKAVGGDFYDFFFVDETHLAVVIADVTDKGVPAALFMMRSKATIKQQLMAGFAPGEALRRANDDLCSENDGDMFVTVWLGVLDLGAGTMVFANGGHNQPMLKRAGGAAGVAEWVPQLSGPVLGGMEGLPYKQFELAFAPGDMLLLYTDGVTEAQNAEREFYDDARLEACLSASDAAEPDAIIADVAADVAAFVAGADQSDDITMVAVRYRA